CAYRLPTTPFPETPGRSLPLHVRDTTFQDRHGRAAVIQIHDLRDASPSSCPGPLLRFPQRCRYREVSAHHLDSALAVPSRRAPPNMTPMDILGYIVVAVVIGVVRGGRIQQQRRVHLQQWLNGTGGRTPAAPLPDSSASSHSTSALCYPPWWRPHPRSISPSRSPPSTCTSLTRSSVARSTPTP